MALHCRAVAVTLPRPGWPVGISHRPGQRRRETWLAIGPGNRRLEKAIRAQTVGAARRSAGQSEESRRRAVSAERRAGRRQALQRVGLVSQARAGPGSVGRKENSALDGPGAKLGENFRQRQAPRKGRTESASDP